MAKQIQSWEESDAFWDQVNQIIPPPERDKEKSYKRIAGGGRILIPYRQVYEGIVYVLRTGCQLKTLRSDLKLNIFGEIFPVPPELKLEYVVATINVK